MSYHSLIALILPVIFVYFFLHIVYFLLKTFKALNGLLCADVPLRNYSLSQLSDVNVQPEQQRVGSGKKFFIDGD